MNEDCKMSIVMQI